MVGRKRKTRRKKRRRKKLTKTRKRRGGGPEIGITAEKFINFYNHHKSLQKALQEKFPKVKNLGQLIRNLTDNQVKRALKLFARPKTATATNNGKIVGMSGGGGGDDELGLADIPWFVWIILVLLALYDSCRYRPPQSDSGGLGY